MNNFFDYLKNLLRWTRKRQGSSTLEYVVVMAAGVALALILNQVTASAEIQGMLKDKIVEVVTGQSTQSALKEKPIEPEEDSINERNQKLFGKPDLSGGLVDQAKGLWDKATNSLKEAWDDISDSVSDDWQSLKEKAQSFMQEDDRSLVQTIKKFGSLLNPLTLMNEVVKQTTGFDPLGSLMDYVVDHPKEAALTSGLILLTIFQPEIGLAGLLGEAGGALSGSLFAGGLSGLAGWAAFRGIAAWMLRSRLGAWLARATSPLMQRMTRYGISGMFGAVTDTAFFHWLQGKWPTIRNVAIAGLVGLTIPFGGEWIAAKAPNLISKINNTPLTAFEVFTGKETATASGSKTIGDTPLGEWLQKFASSGNRNVNLDSVPSVKNGEFNRWFNSLTPDEFDRAWSDPGLRKAIKSRLYTEPLSPQTKAKL